MCTFTYYFYATVNSIILHNFYCDVTCYITSLRLIATTLYTTYWKLSGTVISHKKEEKKPHYCLYTSNPYKSDYFMDTIIIYMDTCGLPKVVLLQKRNS